MVIKMVINNRISLNLKRINIFKKYICIENRVKNILKYNIRKFHGHPSNIDDKVNVKDIDGIKIIKKVIPYLWPKDRQDLKRRVIISVVLLIMGKVFSLMIPYCFKIIIDKLTNVKMLKDLEVKESLEWIIIALIIGYGIARISASLCNEFKNAIFSKVSQGSIREISNESFKHIQNLDLSFHLSRKTGLISKSIDRGTRGIAFILTAFAFNLVPTFLEISMVSFLMGYYFGTTYTLTTISCIGTYGLYTYIITKWRTKYRIMMNKTDNECSSKCFDTFINYETVKYFNNEKFEQEEYDKILAKYEEAAHKTISSLSILNFGQNSIFSIGLVCLMILASNGVCIDILTVGDLVMLNSLLFQLSIPLNFLGSTYRDIRQSLVDLENLFDLLNIKSKVNNNSSLSCVDLEWKNEDMKYGQNLIRFDDVEFSYEDNRKILNKISFCVPYGHKIALVGGSGSGKSTIVRLLYRFFDPHKGSIYINDTNIKNISLDSLRKLISIIPQDQILFHNTIYYNIKYGNINATDNDIYNASQIAGLHECILNFPDQYNTLVGERGLKLSGGEKQRVAIARAILKNSPILIYDEATSSLDTIIEKKILSRINNICKNKTSLMIAHRLSTVVDADQILVLQNGSIIDRGRHVDMIINNPLGIYAQMWNKQHQLLQNSSPVNNEEKKHFNHFDDNVNDILQQESGCDKTGCCSK